MDLLTVVENTCASGALFNDSRGSFALNFVIEYVVAVRLEAYSS